MFKKLFDELGLSDNTYRVYTQLLENGTSTARMLSEGIGIPRASVYDSLKILIQKGLVTERDEENKKRFQVDDVKNLPRVLNEKIDALTKEKNDVEAMLPHLLKQSAFIEPKIKFYSGAEGIRQVLKDMLWYKNIETLTMWPISEMVSILGAEYLADLNRKRIRRKISIRGIWPKDKAVSLREYPFLGIGKEHLRELRSAPTQMLWNMSYWLYADKVAFISSKKESFGFIVHSRDFTEFIKTQFEVIWKISKPIKPEPEYTDPFLETL